MKKRCKFLAIAFATVLCLSTAAPVSAKENSDFGVGESVESTESVAGEEEGIMPLGTSWYTVGNSYTTVAYKSSGINGDVHIAIDQAGYNGLLYQMNIIMTDNSGNVIWRKDNATGAGTSGSWWAGSNVARVQLQIAPRTALSPANSYVVKVTF